MGGFSSCHFFVTDDKSPEAKQNFFHNFFVHLKSSDSNMTKFFVGIFCFKVEKNGSCLWKSNASYLTDAFREGC